MSVTFDYYFNHASPLPELVEMINSRLGCSLAPYEGNPEDLFCRFLSMEFSLQEHELESDGECEFEHYKYQLGFRIPAPDGDLFNLALPALSLIVYVLYQRMNIFGMLVWDVQTLLANYEERFNSESNELELFDIIAGEFVTFPAHFEQLKKRFPK